ncbi:MAG: hypothetical protein AAF483_09320 [Planctomycetota bacterium]
MTKETEIWFTKVRSPDSPEQEDSEHALPPDTLGLALSGGGIRSAAFCMGVMQSLARSGWLKSIDFLSTVSGGGYAGSFLGRFYDQTRAGDGLKGPAGVDIAAAQGHVERELQDPRSEPNSWIRSHANYLAPNGFGEQLFNFVTFWRNLFSLTLIFAFLFVSIFGLAAGLYYLPFLRDFILKSYGIIGALAPASAAAPEWLSPLWLHVTEFSIWLGIVPLVFAYWLGSQDRLHRFVIAYFAALLALTVGCLLALGQPVALVALLAAVGWTVASWKKISADEGLGNPNSHWRLALSRNQLTYWLATAFALTLVLVSFAIIDSIGMWLAKAVLLGEFNLTTILTAIGSAVGVIVAATPAVRTFIWYLSARGSENKGILSILTRIPYLPTITTVLTGVFIPLGLVSFLVHLSYGSGYAFTAGVLTTALAVVITLLLGSRECFPFVNRSSPLSVYSARLARVFLGAVNPRRLRHSDGMDVSHVIEGDDTPFYDYKPHEGGGPLHILNVAVNETYDVVSQRGVNARQSHNLSVGPVGMSIAKDWHAVWEVDETETAKRLRPLVDVTSVHPLNARDSRPAEVESLTLRQWMAISGAAFSPGQGRNTNVARAILMTMANLRLGYWWDSSLGYTKLNNVPFRLGFGKKIWTWFSQWLQGQELLLAELRGKFAGPWKRFWYLSDGGHFEYSGAYELLRRRVPFIIVCDAGADEARSGEIMADLTRIARIDLGAEISDISAAVSDAASNECSDEEQRRIRICEHLNDIGVPENIVCKLGRLSDLLTDDDGKTRKHASLLKVEYIGENDAAAWNGRKTSWMLYLKASVNGDEPIDVLTYKAQNPKFPNQSTLDQFFDEQQWESYRKLGEHVGSEVFE